METVKIKLFGAFQKYIPSAEIEINVNLPMSPKELRSEIYIFLNNLNSNFDDKYLLNESRFATEESLLEETELITEKKLALLPPVCGG